MNQNKSHFPEGDTFRRELNGRYRSATIGQIIFLSALLIAIISLTALLYNIVDGAFGYTAYEYKVDPATITSKPLNELSQPELLEILKANISNGAYNKLNNEQAMETRSQADLLSLVLERIIRIDTKATWSLTQSLFHKAEIEAEVAENYPDARLEFRNWLTMSFLTSPM